MNRLAPLVFASAMAILACGKEKTETFAVDAAPTATSSATGVPHEVDASGIAHGTSGPEPSQVRGDVEVGTPKMTNGALPNGDRILKGIRPRLRSCYTRGLVQNPSMQGKVTLSVKVAANGDVLESKVAENKGIDSLPAECMAAVMKKVQFDAPGGTGASFSVQLTCVLPDAGASDAGH